MNIRAYSKTKVLVLCLTTGGLWSIVWFWNAVRTARNAANQRHVQPLGQTLRYALLPVMVALIAVGTRALQIVLWHPGEHRKEIILCWITAFLAAAVAAPAIHRLVSSQLSELREAAGGLIYIRTPAVTTTVFILLWLAWLLPNPFRFIGLAVVIPILTVQVAINQYLDNLDIHSAEDSHFSPLEILVAILCGAFLLWALGGAFKTFVESFSPTGAPPG